MEALVPAFIAVFLAEFGGTSQRQVEAMLAANRNWLPPLLLLIAIMVASAIGGLFMAPVMPIPARGLLVGLALVVAGAPMLIPRRKREIVPGYVRLIAALMGAGGPFVVMALSARTGMPALAVLGGVLGGLAVLVPQMTTDQPIRRVWPMKAIRRISGAILVLSGLWTALRSLGLI
jgi:putative Ca2+/H+ antiporter (TMEM165/GDT1 family)